MMDASDYDSDDEALQLDYEEAVNEVAELASELRAAEAEAQQLRTRLQAAAAQRGPAASGPGELPPAAAAAEERRVAELRTLLEWLAEHVVLGTAQILDVGFEVPIGGRIVHLRRIAQWPMPTAPGGRLRLSVPVEHQESIAQLISHIQHSAGKVDPDASRRFAAVWDLVPGELATAAPSAQGGQAKPEPSVLLAHRGSTQGMLVATWPSREALEAFSSTPIGVKIGDRVEVEYEGEWYAGVLHGVDADGKASVRCDADPEGVYTVAPICRVRKLRENSGAVAAGASATSAPAGTAAAAAALQGTNAEARGKAPSGAGAAGLLSERGEEEQPRRPGHRRSRSSAL